ncbi:hypothetical protein J6590_100898, partial [Homalodisca vitripennis]
RSCPTGSWHKSQCSPQLNFMEEADCHKMVIDWPLWARRRLISARHCATIDHTSAVMSDPRIREPTSDISLQDVLTLQYSDKVPVCNEARAARRPCHGGRTRSNIPSVRTGSRPTNNTYLVCARRSSVSLNHRSVNL